VTWDRGVALPSHGLWLDPQVVRDIAVVSHAHSDHARRHRVALLTAETLGLLGPKLRPVEPRVVAFGVPQQLAGATLTLLPAGHMLGSAMVLVAHEGARLLYTGDMKLRLGPGRETPLPRADVVVIESTYGRPHFRFPDPESMVEEIAIWCRRLLDSGVTPVLLGHAVGKAQEIMVALAPYGFTFALEHRCLPAARAYAAAGVGLPDFVELSGTNAEGRVVIAPPVGKEAVRDLRRYRTALVSGWAMEPSFWRRFGADVAFPLSDHCDFDELARAVELTGAAQVYTVHGFADDLARTLRRRGVRASALSAVEQLPLF
jgi:Cft2 family RNA processing exonuclease